MESILASTQDHLVSNLAFKLPQNGASYVTDKQQATFFPQGGDVYNPLAGQRVLRFALSSSGYLDLSSLVITMDFKNGPTYPATTLVNGAHCLFTRAGGERRIPQYHGGDVPSPVADGEEEQHRGNGICRWAHRARRREDHPLQAIGPRNL